MAAKCMACSKTVYPMDPQINLDGSIFHKTCAKCKDCNTQITLSNFHKDVSNGETVLLCIEHFHRRFNETNAYPGGDKYSKPSTAQKSATYSSNQPVVRPFNSSSFRAEKQPVSPTIATPGKLKGNLLEAFSKGGTPSTPKPPSSSSSTSVPETIDWSSDSFKPAKSGTNKYAAFIAGKGPGPATSSAPAPSAAAPSSPAPTTSSAAPPLSLSKPTTSMVSNIKQSYQAAVAASSPVSKTSAAAPPASKLKPAALAPFNSHKKSTDSADDSDDKEYSTWYMLACLVAYVALIAGAYYKSEVSTFITNLPIFADSSAVKSSPWVTNANASWVVNQKLHSMENDFQSALLKNNWKVVRSTNNITVEAAESKDGKWPFYLKFTAVFDARPDKLYDYFSWENFDGTQKKVDPFHESMELLFAPSNNIKVIRKTTKRPLLMPKREMTVALVEKTLRSSFKLDNIKVRNAPMKAIDSVKVRKGTLMNAVVNVNVNLAVKEGKKGAKKSGERYIRAYQDMMGWFVPLETGGTLLIGVMKVDLGPDIPRFAFKTALATTVTWSMNALRNLSDAK